MARLVQDPDAAASEKGKDTMTRYLLRVCDETMRGFEGFVWPSSGPVEALDWPRRPLYAFTSGRSHAILRHRPHGWGRRWLVLAAASDDVVRVEPGVAALRRARVVFVGDYLRARRHFAALRRGRVAAP